MRLINFLLLICSLNRPYRLRQQGIRKPPAQLQSGASEKQPPLQVEGFIAQPTVLNEIIEVPGSLLAFETTEIHPEVAGRVVQLNVREGSFVSQRRSACQTL